MQIEYRTIKRGIAAMPCGTVLIEQPFSKVSSCFFQDKLEKAGKKKNISKVKEFNRGQNIWKASHFNI